MTALNVRHFGAIGDGVADDTAALQATLDAAYGAYGHGIDFYLNKAVFIPAGVYKISAPLTIVNTWGAHVFGEGMHSTIIQNTTASQAVIHTNGVGYSTFEHMCLQAAAGGIAFDYDWDKTGLSGQMNTFYKMMFGGSPAYGCRVGWGGHMCDTSSWIDCAFGGATVAGLAVGNLNSIAHSVFGGNFQSNAIGIYVPGGAVQTISGVGFQLSTDWDIRIEGGAVDTYSITGISTESTNFVSITNVAVGAVLSGCAQRSGTNGVFAAGAGMLHIDGCWSVKGIVTAGRNVTLTNSFFKRHDAAFANYWPGLVAQINNCLFGDAVGSLARREVTTTITPAGRRTHRTEGVSLSAESVVNGGLNLNTDGGATSLAIAIRIADPAIFSLANGNPHSFVADLPIGFTTTGSLPNGLSTDVTYYVLADGLTDHAFKISISRGGAAVSLRGLQSGTHSIYLVRVYAVGDQILNSGVTAGSSPGWVCTTAGPALGVAVFKAMANLAA